MPFRERSIVFILVISSFLFFHVNGSNAAKITIKPRIVSSWQSDSNFFKAETGERDVQTYIVQPGIDVGLETAKSKVSLNYTLNAYYYDDRDTVPAGQQKADDNDYVGHTAVFKSRYQAFERLLIGLDDSYFITRDAAQSDSLSNDVGRDKFTINRLTPMLFYNFGSKFTAGMRYRNTETNYSKETNEDSSEHRGMFDLIYNLTSTASLDLEYQHWERDYNKTTSSYTSDQLALILRKQFHYVTVEAGGGYHQRDFDDAAALDDINTMAYRIAVRAQNPPAPDAPRSYLDFSAEMNFNDQGIADSYYKAHRFSLNVGHIFLEKLKVDVGGYYLRADYERTTGLTPAGATELRQDETYYISGSIGYIFTDWLTFSITASHEDRDSNLQGYDYGNTSVIATVKFSHDLGSR